MIGWLDEVAGRLGTAKPSAWMGDVLTATFSRPLFDPAYRGNALVPGGLPIEVSFSELQPERLRIDLQPSDVDSLLEAGRGDVWSGYLKAERFGAFLGTSFGPDGMGGLKAYLEMDHAVAPGALPGPLGTVAALVAECVPGAVPHLIALPVDGGGEPRLYLACRGGLRVLALDGLLARFGLAHRLPALAASVAALTGGRLLLPEDSVLVAVGERDGGLELKVELLPDALAAQQTETLAAIERLLTARPASLSAFRRWRLAVGEASRISVVSVRLTGDREPTLNVYQSFTAEVGERR